MQSRIIGPFREPPIVERLMRIVDQFFVSLFSKNAGRRYYNRWNDIKSPNT